MVMTIRCDELFHNSLQRVDKIIDSRVYPHAATKNNTWAKGLWPRGMSAMAEQRAWLVPDSTSSSGLPGCQPPFLNSQVTLSTLFSIFRRAIPTLSSNI